MDHGDLLRECRAQLSSLTSRISIILDGQRRLETSALAAQTMLARILRQPANPPRPHLPRAPPPMTQNSPPPLLHVPPHAAPSELPPPPPPPEPLPPPASISTAKPPMTTFTAATLTPQVFHQTHHVKGIAGDALAEAGGPIDQDPDAGTQLTMFPKAARPKLRRRRSSGLARGR